MLLALWVSLCLAGGATPRTANINKPLLSLVLLQMGFVATGGRAVRVTDAIRRRDCTHAAADGSGSVRVLSPYEPPAAGLDALRERAEAVLAEGSLRLDAIASQDCLARALTLRGGALGLSLPGPLTRAKAYVANLWVVLSGRRALKRLALLCAARALYWIGVVSAKRI